MLKCDMRLSRGTVSAPHAPALATKLEDCELLLPLISQMTRYLEHKSIVELDDDRLH
jgi:hypothetical protein